MYSCVVSTSSSGHGAQRLSLHSAEIFAERWHKEESEKQNAQSFWREFFIDVCGVSDLREAEIEFERPVINSKKGTTNSIDVFWKNTVLIEHKSAGKNLDVAEQQARGYIVSLPPALGVTKAKRRVSKKTGIPLSRGGRRMKLGKWLGMK
jgi:hypothetical protein